MQKKNSNRMNRVDEEYKREISKIIDQDLKNPNITGLISVTKVKTSPDLKSARVYISILNSKSKKNTMQGLKNATGFIKKKHAKKAKTPKKKKGLKSKIKKVVPKPIKKVLKKAVRKK